MKVKQGKKPHVSQPIAKVTPGQAEVKSSPAEDVVERRSHPRFECRLNGHLTRGVEVDWAPVTIADLGYEGAFVITALPLEAGEQIWLALPLEDDDQGFRVLSAVVRRGQLREDHGYGVRFLESGYDLQDKIDRLLGI